MKMLNKWEYALTIEEEALCAKIGWQRQQPMLGKPEKNVNYSEGDMWETLQHMICAGSELAFARMMGKTDFTPHVNKYKSTLDIPGYGEVRYAFPQGFPHKNGTPKGLRITTHDNPNNKYALLIGGPIQKIRRTPPNYQSQPYIAIGWLYGHEAKQPQWQYNNTTWYAPINKLRPLHTTQK